MENENEEVVEQTTETENTVTDTAEEKEVVTNDNIKQLKLDNITEITSYTTKLNGQEIAGIDKDSKPESAVAGDNRTYEDDTDRAPGFIIKLQKEREINGNVFEDKSEVKQNERIGNGKLDAGESMISGVKVQLVDKNGNIAKLYDEENKRWKEGNDLITTTDSNGNYHISGFIPGDDYKIKFTWGNEQYKVQDYKGTIYISER